MFKILCIAHTYFMLAISLIFVGITLIVNGILLMQQKNLKTLVVFNLFTGFIILLFNLYSILVETDPTKLIGYFGGLLFGFTNILIAFDNIFKEGTYATGIYSGFATISAITLGTYFLVQGQVLQGISWMVWSLIWLFTFIALVINRKFKKSSYVMYIVQGVVTTFVFGFLQLLGIVNF